ncbi:GNAT family N-acetyltransferase [Motiliproteus sp.]|uniref:GNAT family N-acetyltransferase n=1 Tax=Motiliproteus sp. TaxID=1898955 RepID=UPI003BA88C3E
MIREMTAADFEQFWPTFSAIITAQESYSFDPDMSYEQAYQLWCLDPLRTLAFVEDGKVLGSYYIKPNAAGPGDHICNCGYMVSPHARGCGIATALCEHSQQMARELGFKAMQFNAVVSTNEDAIRLWQKLGFQIIGTIPSGYRHRQLGYVDSYIMHKSIPG